MGSAKALRLCDATGRQMKSSWHSEAAARGIPVHVIGVCVQFSELAMLGDVGRSGREVGIATKQARLRFVCAEQPTKTGKENVMRMLLGALATSVVIALPALAQSPNAAGQTSVPSAQNSGAGIPGQPGNKSGPAARPSGDLAAQGTENNNAAVRQQDAAGIPGKPGSKSGPSERPSGSGSK